MKWFLLGLSLEPIFLLKVAVLAMLVLVTLAGVLFYLFHRGIADFQDYE